MKYLPILILVVAGLWLGSIWLRAEEPTYVAPVGEIPSSLSGAAPAGYVVRTFAVEGMCCGSCTRKLHQALVSLEGVEEAAIDLDGGTAAALVESDVPVEELVAALAVEEKYSVRPLP